jgi:hypothetical protein
MPNVSILVTACNAGPTVGAALESAFAQTYQDFEVIVVDNASSDDTARRVADYGERVVYLHQPDSGPWRARNEAIKHARGALVAFLDADDVWFPRKLQRQVAYLERHRSAAMVHTSAIVSAHPTTTMRENADRVPPDRLPQPPARIFCDLFHGDVAIDTATVLAQRDALLDVGGFDADGEQLTEEWGLWLRVASRFAIGYFDLPLVVHRPRSRPPAGDVTFDAQERVIQKHAATCAVACARHRLDAAACVLRRRHQLYIDLGRERFWSGRRAAARAAFGEAIRTRPSAALPYAYHGASLLGSRILGPMLRVRQMLRSNGVEGAERAPAFDRSDLLNGTQYRQTRRAIVRSIHAADDVVSRLGRADARVLFEAASPMSLAVFGPVLDRLRHDERIQFWFMTSDDAWDGERIFRAAGLNDRIVTPDVARWMKFDAYVNTDFWNMTWLPRRPQRVHMFHGVAGKYGLDAPVQIAPTIASFDRLLFPNRDRLRRYAEAGLIDADGPQAALVGYPKVDCLVDGSLDRWAIERSLGLDPSAPTVLYAPTWSPYSSLHSMGIEVITGLSKLGINVLVKLHDRSYDPGKRASGGVDWRMMLERLSVRGNVHVARGADASPYLFVSDALVTDHSSVGFEFMLLDRPVIVIDCPKLIEKARVSADKVNELRGAAAVARTAADVVALVGRELNHPARLSCQRRRIAEQLFYGAGGATGRAVQCIYDLLALPAPTTAPEAERRSAAQSTSIRSVFIS